MILAPATADLIPVLLPEWRMTWYRRFVWLHLACSRAPRHEPADVPYRRHPDNLEVLASRGLLIWGPDSGSRLVVISAQGECSIR